MNTPLAALLSLALAPSGAAPASSSDWESAPEVQPPATIGTPSSSNERADRPWYAHGGFGLAFYGIGGFGPAVRAAFGREWWDRGLGLELQGQLVLPVIGMQWIADGIFSEGALTGAGTGFPLGDLTARFRFGKTKGRGWIHGIVPLGFDLLSVQATRSTSTGERTKRETSVFLSTGIGFGARRRFNRNAFVGVDLTATGGVSLNEPYGLYALRLRGRVRAGGDAIVYFGGNF